MEYVQRQRKGLIVSQRVFDGGSSLSEIQVSNTKFFLKDFFENIEQEVFRGNKFVLKFNREFKFKLKDKNVEVLKRQLELTKEQFQIGEVTMTDVSIAEARLSLAESENLQSINNQNFLKQSFSVFE